MPALNQPEENVQALKGLIGWFNQSSLELIQQYRRLVEWADCLKEPSERARAVLLGQKISMVTWTI